MKIAINFRSLIAALLSVSFAQVASADVLLGDVNRDTIIDGLDIEPFVHLLVHGGYQAEADINQDGVVDALDIDPFLPDFHYGPSQSLNVIPEPSTSVLLAAAGFFVGFSRLSRRRDRGIEGNLL